MTRVITRTAGVHKFAIVVRGVSAHTSRHREGIDSAIQALRHMLDLIETTPLGLHNERFPELPRLQVASIVAGRGEQHELSGISYSADKATALMDIRYPPPFEPLDVQGVLEHMTASLAEQNPSDRFLTDASPGSGLPRRTRGHASDGRPRGQSTGT